jgi:methylase of polypeptide subunit release factors
METAPKKEQKSGNPKWEKDVREMFGKLRGSPDIKEAEVNGINIKILPGVFSPEIFFESRWFAEKISKIAAGKRLLEIGPGTGIIGLSAANNGAEVTVVDVNEDAVKNTRLNFVDHGLNVDAYLGSVYEPLDISKKHDVIFWNHPFNKTEQMDTDSFLKSVFDYQYEHLETYIREGGKYLSSEGRLLLGTSNIADLDEIKELANKYDYDFVLIDKIDRPTEVDGSSVDFRIYEFIKRVVK